MPSKYSNMMVHKPWGFEYLFYENEEVAIWCLHMNAMSCTSLHCHPNKKTGLIMLEGLATLSFLNDTVEMKPLDRHILRPGLFHSTIARTHSILLEIETPPNKEDIVRFDDKYGRKGKPIEGKKEMSELPPDLPVLEGERESCDLGGCRLAIKNLDNFLKFEAVIAILKGGLIAGEDEDLIVSPGDVGSMNSFLRLGKSFPVLGETELLTICALQP